MKTANIMGVIEVMLNKFQTIFDLIKTKGGSNRLHLALLSGSSCKVLANTCNFGFKVKVILQHGF